MTNIHSTATIYPNVTIHPTAYIGPGCVIGAPPEIRGNRDAGCGVTIGEGARLEKNVVVDAGVKGRTIIGENVMLMSGVHIGHDAILEPYVTIAPHGVVGGHVRICEGATIGMGATIHQHQIIGHYAMLGMGAALGRRSFHSLVLPGQTWAGVPAKYLNINKIGLERNDVSAESLTRLTQVYLDMYPMQVGKE